MTAVKMMLLALVVLMMGCGGNSADLSAPLEGVWLSAIETGGYQGYQFDADGQVHFLNMMTMTGDRWERTGDGGLDISSHTDRYPQPETDQYLIRELSAENLLLVPSDNANAPGDLYHRFSPQSLADRMVGRWSNSPETFFDITPAGQWYRVVFKWSGGIQTLSGEATAEGMDATADGKTLHLTLSADADGQELCLNIDGRVFSCRSGI